MSISMRNRLLPICLVAVIAAAGPAYAQSPSIEIANKLAQQGYSSVTVTRTFLGRDRIVATDGRRTREIVVNSATGEILRDYTENRRRRGAGSGLLGGLFGSTAEEDDDDDDDGSGRGRGRGRGGDDDDDDNSGSGSGDDDGDDGDDNSGSGSGDDDGDDGDDNSGSGGGGDDGDDGDDGGGNSGSGGGGGGNSGSGGGDDD